MTSTTNTKKKLIEVAIPLEAINAASAKEKGSPFLKGHARSLHQWWARRPIVACRAILFAQLVDDPSSDLRKFPTHEAQEAERKRLFGIIEELVQWENSTNEELLERARSEIRKSCAGELPPIYDPFSGGGSIPLEAQRLGLPAYGSDLNPVAVMIGKAMIEIPPKFKDQEPIHPGAKERHFYRNAEGMAEDIKYYGDWMRAKAWERIGHLYPQIDLPKESGGGKATVIAWVWARTVPSPDPAFEDVEVPIASSFLLSSQAGKEVWVEPIVDRKAKTISWHIRQGGTKSEIAAAKEGTKSSRANFHCLMSGLMGQTLMAIVAEGKSGKRYIEPNDDHIVTAFDTEAATIAKEVRETFLSGETPARLTGGTCHAYGLDQWGKLFTDRQLVALNTFSDLLRQTRAQIQTDALAAGLAPGESPLRDGGTEGQAYSEALSLYLALAVDKFADYGNSISGWNSTNQNIRQLFARQAIPMSWDFVEANPFGKMASFSGFAESVAGGLSGVWPAASGTVFQADAAFAIFPADNCVISTDPPYYDNIGYADLSDFFYVWLRRAIKDIFPEVASTLSVPKAEELVATAYRHGGRDEAEAFFLRGMTAAITSMANQSTDEFPATIYYAFKQSEVEEEGLSSTGWATFLQAVIVAGYSIVGTWPVRTERAARTIASGTNALANSVVLVCRKRQASADVITRAEFIRTLKRELPPAIAELQLASIAPADMPQSAIGPGMGVFSRYKAVLESDDRPMSVKTALQLINRELDEYLGGIQGEFDADTRFAITWFEQNGIGKGDYGVADNLARARGISVDSVKHAGIIESAAGKVRILLRDELDDEWDPEDDRHLTVWECLQHLVQLHEKDGISHDTAVLFKKISAQAEAVKDLAYCLYDISANKRKDAKEATVYNALIADWTELTKAAAAIRDTSGERQSRLDI
jgi:putative DNA methylase